MEKLLSRMKKVEKLLIMSWCGQGAMWRLLQSLTQQDSELPRSLGSEIPPKKEDFEFSLATS